MRPTACVALIAAVIFAPMAAGCSAAVEQRVETGLVEAGLPAAVASCMAEIWADDLSVDQIREISRFADAVQDDEQALTVGRLVDHVREWNDPEALAVVTASAARCAIA